MGRIVVNTEDVERIKKLVGMFETVRKPTLISVLTCYFGCSEDAAKKILGTLLKRKVVYQKKNTYNGWQIIQSTPDKIVDQASMDVFEAYAKLFTEINAEAEETDRGERRIKFIEVGKQAFPYDFLFAVNTAEMYRVIAFDDSGYQKMVFASKEDVKRRDDDILLVVVTSRTEPDAGSLEIELKHRIAIVRTQGKKAVCKITGIIED